MEKSPLDSLVKPMNDLNLHPNITQNTSSQTKFTLVDNETDLKAFKAEVSQLKSNPDDLIIDCEGKDLHREGILSIVQIGFKDRVFLLDVLKLPKVIDIVKDILEDSSLRKLAWDFRNDYDILYHQFNITTVNLLDVQLYYYYIQNKSNCDFTKDSEILLFWYNMKNSNKGKFLPGLKDKSSKYETLNLKDWTDRPLSELNLEYAAKDIYEILKKYKECRMLNYNTFDSKDNKDPEFVIASSKRFIGLYKNMPKRKFDKYEFNAFMPLHVFMQWDCDVVCKYCWIAVPWKCVFYMTEKKLLAGKCYRCGFRDDQEEYQKNKGRVC